MGRDLVVTRSSVDSCRPRFAIAAVQAVELKWLIVNKVNKMFPLITCEIPLVKISASWVFGVDI